MSEFEVEQRKPPFSPTKNRRRGSDPEHNKEATYRTAIAAVVSAKARPFAVAGRVPMDPAHLTLFFRSQVSTFLRRVRRALPSRALPGVCRM